MTKKLAHSVIIFLDLLSLLGVWYAYCEVQLILTNINNNADIIKFGNRDLLLILVLIVPICHVLAVVEHFYADIVKTYNRVLNYCVIFLFFILLSAGFFGSYWIKARVENAGYIYCRNASGISALAKTLVYTKRIDICEELVETKRKR
jgi:hypothetical protein